MVLKALSPLKVDKQRHPTTLKVPMLLSSSCQKLAFELSGERVKRLTWSWHVATLGKVFTLFITHALSTLSLWFLQVKGDSKTVLFGWSGMWFNILICQIKSCSFFLETTLFPDTLKSIRHSFRVNKTLWFPVPQLIHPSHLLRRMNFYFTDLEQWLRKSNWLEFRTEISNKLTEAASTETAQG